MTTFLGLLAVLVLTLGTGFFVVQEFAYVAADRTVLREQAARGDVAAERALRVTGRLSFMLSGAQLGITVTTLLVGFIAEPAIGELLRPVLDALGLPAGVVPGLVVVLALVVSAIVQMVLGELAPKNLGIARPEPAARFLARAALAYLAVAGPLIRLFDGAATRLLRRVGVEPVEEVEHGATPEELARIIAESEAAGELPGRLSDLLERALEFGDRTAEDVMVPRPRVVSLRADRPVADVLDAVRRSGHSVYPVLGTSGDDVLGVTGLRELLAADDGGPIAAMTRPPVLVPESLPLPAVLERMREAGDYFACVIDEYGGLAGVVSIEDLAEELVGELMDENDPEPLGAVKRGDEGWDVPAMLRLDEVERATGVGLPESEDYETVGGLVMARLGRLAAPGDAVVVPVEEDTGLLDEERAPRHALLTVLDVQRRVPARVRLAWTTREPTEPDHAPVHARRPA
jgi:CBS domain containing-hemolysin-like protein